MATKENLTQHGSFAHLIDHTLLKATATQNEISNLCREAIEYKFYSVCIPSSYVLTAKQLLASSNVKVCTVVGFPLGNSSSSTKVRETEVALENGANEIDMVMNLGFFKSGDLQLVKEDISSVVKASSAALVKVILETCYLSNDEIVEACKICVDSGAHFVKTSTGFGTAGASAEHIHLMRKTVGSNIGVKASGGIRDLDTLKLMVENGANRIGCSSGVQIIQGLKGAGY